MKRLRRLLWKQHLVGILIAVMVVISTQGLIGRTEARQDDAGWSFYLFNDLTNELIRVEADGTQTTFDLGLGDLQNPDENTSYLASTIAFSADGQQAAYCISQISLEGLAPTFFVVRDIETETDIINIELGTPLGCHLTSRAFGTEDSQVAMGVVTSFPDNPEADPDVPSWYLRIYDIESGDISYEMTANMSPFSEASSEFAALMPDVRYFDGTQLIFAQVPWGTGGAPEYNAFNWQYVDGEVAAIDLYGKSSIDTLGGYLIYVDNDPNLPSGIPSGPIGNFNVLMQADKSGEIRMIYHSPEWIIASARFINNGQQIAMRLLESTPTEIASTRWIALNRDGSMVDLQPEYVGYDDVIAAPGGHIYIQNDFNPDNTFTRVTRYVDGEENVVFETNEAALRLLWAMPTELAEGLPEFPDFTP